MTSSLDSTTNVSRILKAWVNNFLEDVPAIHKSGEYLIEYHTLVEHLNNLSYEDLTQIMLEAREENS